MNPVGMSKPPAWRKPPFIRQSEVVGRSPARPDSGNGVCNTAVVSALAAGHMRASGCGRCAAVALWCCFFSALILCPRIVAGHPEDSLQCLLAQTSFSKNVSSAIALGQRNLTFDVVNNMLAQLLGACTGEPVLPVRPVNGLMSSTAVIIDLYQPKIEALSGIPMRYTFRDYYDVLREVLFQLQNGLSTFDTWMFDSTGLVDIAEATPKGGFVDLTQFISEDDSLLNWNDIHPFFRSVSSLYKGAVIGVPFISFQPYLYYRRDVFARYNLTVPTTWDDFVSLAERMNGTDFNGDGKPDNSLCFHDSPEKFLNAYHAIMILASHVQTNGPSHGVLWDPATMEPLVGTSAMRATLQLLQRMSAMNGMHGMASDDVNDFRKCLMTVDNAEMFKASWRWSTILGSIGVAMVPGSSQVLDRSTMQLVPCTPDICRDEGGKVNRAPIFGPPTVNIAINPYASDDYQRAAWQCMAAAGGPSIHTTYLVLSPITPVGPIRLSTMDTSPAGLKMWTSKGYNANDTSRFLTITKATLDHPNRVGEISIKSMDKYRQILDSEVTLLFRTSSRSRGPNTASSGDGNSNDQLAESFLQSIDSRFRAQMASEPDPQHVADGYRALLKFSFPSPPPPSPPPPSPPPAPPVPPTDAMTTSKEDPMIWIIAPVVATVVISVALVAGFMQYMRKTKRRHRALLGGAVIAPMLGPDTTLLLTDIEGSTRLFEAVPEAMDQALAIHNALMHRIVNKHTGYASASEGDGFIIAFHSAVDALGAAAELQELLMTANWPTELLTQPLCAPVWMSAKPTGPLASAWPQSVVEVVQNKKEWKGMHSLAALTGTSAGVPGDRAGRPDLKKSPSGFSLRGMSQWRMSRATTNAGSFLDDLTGEKPGGGWQLHTAVEPRSGTTPPRKSHSWLGGGGAGNHGPANSSPGFFSPSRLSNSGTAATVQGRQLPGGLKRATLTSLTSDQQTTSPDPPMSPSRQQVVVPMSPNRQQVVIPMSPSRQQARVVNESRFFTGSGSHATHAKPLLAAVLKAATAAGQTTPGGPATVTVVQGADLPVSSEQQLPPSQAEAPILAGYVNDRLSRGALPCGSQQQAQPDSTADYHLQTVSHEATVSSRQPGQEAASSSLQNAAGGIDPAWPASPGTSQTEVARHPIQVPPSPENAGLPRIHGISLAALLGSVISNSPGVYDSPTYAQSCATPTLNDPQQAAQSLDPNLGFTWRTFWTAAVTWSMDAHHVADPTVRSSVGNYQPESARVHSLPTGRGVRDGSAALIDDCPPPPQRHSLYGAPPPAKLFHHEARPSATRRQVSGSGTLPTVHQTNGYRTSPVDSQRRALVRWPTDISISNVHLAMDEEVRSSGWDRSGSVLVHRGLRVRMGAHSGLSDASEVTWNAATGRHQYGGQFLSIASAVCNAANGGMILVSQSTFKTVCSCEALTQAMTILAAGEHYLKNFTGHLFVEQQCIYEVIPHSVALRSLVLERIRSQTVISPGYQATPCGNVAVAFFQAAGVPSLMSWDADITRDSLGLMADMATALLGPFNGYLLDCSEALGVLAAFSSAADAIKWALVTQQALLQANWHEQLLAHPLGEEITVSNGAMPYGGYSNVRRSPDSAGRDASSPTSPMRPRPPQQGHVLEIAAHSGAGMADRLSDQAHTSSWGSPAATARRASASFRLVGRPLDRVSYSHGNSVVGHPAVILRGLRTKCGIDVGHVRTSVNNISGRMTCIGKVMNRAARVTGLVKSSQVWCSAEAWDASLAPGCHPSTTAAGLAASQDPSSMHFGTLASSDLSMTRSGGAKNAFPTLLEAAGQSMSGFRAPSRISGGGHATLREDQVSAQCSDDRSIMRVPSTTSGPIGAHKAASRAHDIQEAVVLAGELAACGVSAVSLGRHRLKSIATPAHLIKVELDQQQG